MQVDWTIKARSRPPRATFESDFKFADLAMRKSSKLFPLLFPLPLKTHINTLRAAATSTRPSSLPRALDLKVKSMVIFGGGGGVLGGRGKGERRRESFEGKKNTSASPSGKFLHFFFRSLSLSLSPSFNQLTNFSIFMPSLATPGDVLFPEVGQRQEFIILLALTQRERITKQKRATQKRVFSFD
jgi:hypothetical protein